MDSKTDAPVILTDAYSQLVGYATMEGIAKAAGLRKKDVTGDKPVTNTETGVCTAELKVLKKGSEGDQVKALQMLLLGYGCKMTNNGKTYGADGDFGTATANGVKSFQKKNGLPQTGECDAKTWAKLLGV